MTSFLPCPKCGVYDYHKSHMRNVFEQLRQLILPQRPYRCHSCNYRSWVFVKITRKKLSAKTILLYVGVFAVSVLVGLIIGSSIK